MFKLPRHILRLKANFRTQMKLKSNLTCEEIRIPVPWGHIAGKWWGPTNRRPVLVLHGWLDNCGSFDRLIPLLNNDLSFLAIDFPGHGLSSRIPSGLYCHCTDFVHIIQNLINYFKWPKVSLMGHSMGGGISSMFAMINPQMVDFLICIDGFKPVVLEDRMSLTIDNIIQFPRLAAFEQSTTEPPSYTLEEIKKTISTLNENSVAYEHCEHLIERNIAPSKLHSRRYFFTIDPRLKLRVLWNWPQEDMVALARNMKCPVLLAKGKTTSYFEAKENFYEFLGVLKQSSVDCQYHRLEGTHHLHLNNPEVLGGLIKEFIKKHNKEDRSVGGMKKKMRQ